MSFLLFRRRIRHPFFPALPAYPAAHARGRTLALAGTFPELSAAAARGAKPKRAIYVLTGQDHCLSEEEREQLWYLFGVPIYTLWQRGGRVEAWECEAQRGLHTAENTGEVICACGRPGPVISQSSRTVDIRTMVRQESIPLSVQMVP